MADILNPSEGSNPQVGLKNIFIKLKEIIRTLNTAVSNIATNTSDIVSLNESVAALTPVYKAYKALLGQNAPVATTTDPTMVAGQIWTLESYNAADAVTIAALELISGTLYAVGSKYRSATDQTLDVNVATTLSYDGAPYVVSKNSDGDFAPLVNTLSGTPVWSYSAVGTYLLTLTDEFILNKTIVLIGDVNNELEGSINHWHGTDDEIYVYSRNTSFINSDDLLNNGNGKTSITIEIYP